MRNYWLEVLGKEPLLENTSTIGDWSEEKSSHRAKGRGLRKPSREGSEDIIQNSSRQGKAGGMG